MDKVNDDDNLRMEREEAYGREALLRLRASGLYF